MEILIREERRLRPEVHMHRCPIHARGKGESFAFFEESNEVCQKTLRGTGLEFHDFPCMNCCGHWRNAYGGEMLVDGLISLEEAERFRDLNPQEKVDEREGSDLSRFSISDNSSRPKSG
jgi:hypothetical protein